MLSVSYTYLDLQLFRKQDYQTKSQLTAVLGEKLGSKGNYVNKLSIPGLCKITLIRRISTKSSDEMGFLNPAVSICPKILKRYVDMVRELRTISEMGLGC